MEVKMDLDQKRRKMLKVGVASIAAVSTGFILKNTLFDGDNSEKIVLLNEFTDVNKNKDSLPSAEQLQNLEHELSVRDSLGKTRNFNSQFTEDIFLANEKKLVFEETLNRISRVKKTVGYANFNLLAFDDMLRFAHRYPQIGRFTKAELALIDELFFFDANEYGFHGNKVIQNLTAKVNKRDTVKISGSGHYVFQGEALDKFNMLKKDVGEDLILTSGIRSVVKQLQLFLAKIKSSEGNLSMASRSLAPPGHSYHGIGDFDVGKRGFGKLNFTSRFSTTKEYQKLIELKYIDLRYTKNNQIGVRYEPWHIKVV